VGRVIAGVPFCRRAQHHEHTACADAAGMAEGAIQSPTAADYDYIALYSP